MGKQIKATASVPENKNITFEVKSLKEDGTFEGYASTFGGLDAYDDTIEPGAYAESIKSKTPVLLWQHDAADVIGMIEELKEDAHGLYMKARLLVEDIGKAKEAYALLKAKALSGLSIGFIPVEYWYEKSDKAKWGEIRHLKKIDLWEVSLVTFPADGGAGVTGVKSYADMGPREIEDVLRDAGMSRKEAKSLISRCKELQRDAESNDHAHDNAGVKSALEDLLKTIKEVH